MVSKEGFQFHVNNVEHHAKWVEFYKGETELEEVAQQSVDRSKQVLVDTFVEQQNQIERYEKALKRIASQTNCDDTWDFANRVLEGKPNNDLFYRINID